MATLPQLYRSTLRQFFKNSIHPRSARSPTIPALLRVLFESGRTIDAGSAAASRFQRDVENMVVFLRARRIHKELVDRYNPTHDMSQAERIEATAHRVGLQGPVEYDASNPRSLPEAGESVSEATKEQGSLQTMFAPQH
ncbi:hypothetical protein Rt10032_c04g1912 [Rhodotorula toruloides]|uniref:Complex 1 LYR protein n=1 Tax=Rhodotorula toruloides TaxID=5286 RepID=A0A511KD28_RHOTO|nr:hypothetical protein Rt10032_c04g1912 [Rhodotorula toruloides]